MSVIANSFIAKYIIYIVNSIGYIYGKSVFKSKVNNFLRKINSFWSNSILVGFCCKEGSVSMNFSDSYTLKIIEFIINLPATILRWIFEKLKNIFEGSFFVNLVFCVSKTTSLCIGWLMVLIFVCPYEMWNNAYSLMGFVAIMLLFYLGGIKDKNFKIDIKAIGPYLLFFIGSLLLACAVSYSTAQSFRFLYYHGSAMLCVLMVVSSVRCGYHLRRIAGMTTLSLFFIALYGVFQGLQGVEVNASYVDLSLNADMPGRVFGMYDNPNAYAEVLVMLIPVSLGLMFGAKKSFFKFLSFFSMTVGIIALGMTYSRASFIGIAVAFFCFVFLYKRRIIPFFALLAIFLIPFLPSSIYNRILTIFDFTDSSTSSRFPLYKGAIDAIMLRPFRGIGLGGEVVQTFIKDYKLYDQVSPFVHAHNMILQVWLETGIIGISTFFATIICSFKRVFYAVSQRKCNADIKFITIGATSSVAGVFVNGLADYPWHYPRVMLIFWFIFAIMLAGLKLAVYGEEDL